MQYGIEKHRHNFSVWAAARAAQRGFTNVTNLRKALEICGVVKFLETRDSGSVEEAEFNVLHRAWCREIMTWLKNAGVDNVTFGRAAKLIAIYLKSAVVLAGKDRTCLGKVAHPPIDSILLANVVAAVDVASPHKSKWARVRWTKLNEEEYYIMVGELRAILAPEAAFWELERFWTVTDEKEDANE